MRSLALAGLVTLLLAGGALAAPPPELEPFSFLVGEWRASGSGEPGVGTGAATFARELQGQVIVRRSFAGGTTSRLIRVVRRTTEGLSRMASQVFGWPAVLGALGVSLEAAPPDLVVSGAVEVPWAGTAEWTMRIDPEGNVTGAARGATCRATSEERSELDRLVSTLPIDHAEYRFGARGPATDVRRRVTLRVRRSGRLRSYVYWPCDERPCPDQAGMDAMDGLWRFLRGLCQPRDANQPGPGAKP